MNTQDNIFDAAERDTSLAVTAYALGHGSAEERAAFEHRLEQEPELAERLAEERAFIEDFRTAIPAGMPPADGFNRLQLVSPTRRSPVRGLMAAAVAAVAVGVVLMLPQPEPGFETLSSDSAAGIVDAYSYRIVMQPGIATDTRDRLREEYGFDIIESGDVVGSIVARRSTPLDEREMAALRRTPGISLVERQYQSRD